MRITTNDFNIDIGTILKTKKYVYSGKELTRKRYQKAIVVNLYIYKHCNFLYSLWGVIQKLSLPCPFDFEIQISSTLFFSNKIQKQKALATNLTNLKALGFQNEKGSIFELGTLRLQGGPYIFGRFSRLKVMKSGPKNMGHPVYFE